MSLVYHKTHHRKEKAPVSDTLRERLAQVIREHARALDEKPRNEAKVKALQVAARELRAALRKERAT